MKDQLQKQKEGKGHWKSELSSNSEANVGLLRGQVFIFEAVANDRRTIR